MKQNDILKLLAKDLKVKSHDLESVNKGLKAKDSVKLKYRLSGKKLGHYGFTGLIKALTVEGVKVFDVKKVTLIPYESIENFEHAKPREKRPTSAKPTATAIEKSGAASVKSTKAKLDTATPEKAKSVEKAKPSEKSISAKNEIDGDDDVILRRKKKPTTGSGQSGSKYIPKR